MKKLVPENLNEAIEDILVPKKLPLNKQLEWYAMKGDLYTFFKTIDKGAKITYSLLRKIMNFYSDSKSALFIDYLKNNEDLKKISAPEDFEKINAVLNLNKPGKLRSYPPLYKPYRVLKYVDEQYKKKTPIKRRLDLVKLIYELGYGPNTYNELSDDTAYWSHSYTDSIGQYLSKDEKGGFYLNDKGKMYLKELTKKFKDVDLNPLV